MGKFSERLATIISADLIQWRDMGGNKFEGIVFNSIEKGVEDGTRAAFEFVEVTRWPALNKYWEEHLVGKTWTGHYIKMDIRFQIKHYNGHSS